jgi:CheY-like chemotaxis protein
VDHGTCITLTVPRAEPLVTVPMETPIESAGAIPLRVIVVEDDPEARAAFEAALAGWGVQCAAVATPADAIVALTQAAAPFALVITDHDLGDSATGLELVARMRGLVPTPLAAILVSGAMTAELESRAREADCIPLRKPISPVRLRATLAYIARSTG